MSESYSVIYSQPAKDDLMEIYTYIAFNLQMPDIAEGQVNRIRQAVRSLNFMPSRYVNVEWEPWKSMGMHQVPVDNFVVYYLVNDEEHTVSIIRIFYSGQDIEGIIKQERDNPLKSKGEQTDPESSGGEIAVFLLRVLQAPFIT